MGIFLLIVLGIVLYFVLSSLSANGGTRHGGYTDSPSATDLATLASQGESHPHASSEATHHTFPDHNHSVDPGSHSHDSGGLDGGSDGHH